MAEKVEDTQDDKPSASVQELWEQSRAKELATRLNDAQKAIELGSRSAILLGGACYVAGLLIANLHLGQYGVYNLSILRAQYVLVGALWIFLVASAAALLLFALNHVKQAYAEARTTGSGSRIVGKLVEALLAIVTEFAGWAFLVSFVSGYQVTVWISPAVALRAFGILLIGAIAWVAAFRDVRSLRAAVADVSILRHPDMRRIPGLDPLRLSLSAQTGRGFLELSVRVILNIGALSAYALYVYPYFPRRSVAADYP